MELVPPLAALSCTYAALTESPPTPGGSWLCAWWTKNPIAFLQPLVDSSVVCGSLIGLSITDVVLCCRAVCLQRHLSVLLTTCITLQVSPGISLMMSKFHKFLHIWQGPAGDTQGTLWELISWWGLTSSQTQAARDKIRAQKRGRMPYDLNLSSFHSCAWCPSQVWGFHWLTTSWEQEQQLVCDILQCWWHASWQHGKTRSYAFLV